MHRLTLHASQRRLVWLIGAGWLLGLVAQIATRLWTARMDVLPPQGLLGALLCGAAGAAAWGTIRGRRPTAGLLAGAGLAGSIVVGYAALTALLWNPAWPDGTQEPWRGAVLEAALAVPVALALGAACGFVGWRLVARRR